MCYVIENFSPKFTSLRWFIRMGIFFILRNIRHIFNVTLFLFSNFFLNNNLNLKKKQLNYLLKGFFSKTPFRVLSQTNMSRRIPLTVNTHKTLRFVLYQNFLQQFDLLSQEKKCLIPDIVSYHHYLPNQLIYLKLGNCKYKLILFKLLNITTTVWFQINIFKKLLPHPLIASSQNSFLRYYNSYFFRIYIF